MLSVVAGGILCLLSLGAGAWVVWSYSFGSGSGPVALRTSSSPPPVRTSEARHRDAARAVALANVPGMPALHIGEAAAAAKGTSPAKGPAHQDLGRAAGVPAGHGSLASLITGTGPGRTPGIVDLAEQRSDAQLRPAVVAFGDTDGAADAIYSQEEPDPNDPLVVAMHPSAKYHTQTSVPLAPGPHHASAAVVAQGIKSNPSVAIKGIDTVSIASVASAAARQIQIVDVGADDRPAPAFPRVGLSTTRPAIIAKAPASVTLSSQGARGNPKPLELRKAASPPLIASHAELINENLRLEDARKFVMSMCVDHEGRLWVGTEGGGVQRFDPSAPPLHQWTQFTTSNGLGDDYGYAIACDQHDRIWVGHLNHGVSVYNGNSEGKWQCYEVLAGLSRPDTLSGPLGERTFAIAVCPTNGDVWIGTNRGLTGYSVSSAVWSYRTKFDGMPSDAVTALAFDSAGRLYCGTDADGIAMADPADDYKSWRVATAGGDTSLVPGGKGLPTDLVSALLVARDGTVYAGTPMGLALSRDRGQMWQFVRGRDYAAKVRGQYGGPPKGWKEASGPTLLEDYVTTLAQGPTSGTVFVGHWQEPAELLDASARGMERVHVAQCDNYQSSIINDGVSGLTFFGSHNGVRCDKGSSHEAASPIRAIRRSELPVGAVPPDARSLASIVATPLRAQTQSEPHANGTAASVPVVQRLDDDWRTQGDWDGRYGRYWASLCSMAGHDYFWGAGEDDVQFRQHIGPHCGEGDSIRFWIDRNYTADHRQLEIPPVYMDSRVIKGLTTPLMNRRESQNDDHGEDYGSTWEGPDLYYDLWLPPGRFVLSLYEVNGRMPPSPRDFRVSIRPGPSSKSASATADDLDFESRPELARGRVCQFFGGVYKRFVAVGPQSLTVKIYKQKSINAIAVGLMLDLLDEEPVSYFPGEGSSPRAASNRPKDSEEAPSDAKATGEDVQWFRRTAEQVKQRLTATPGDAADISPAFYAGMLRRYRAHPTLAAVLGSDHRVQRLLGTCYYNLQLFDQWERRQEVQGLTPARRIEKSLRWDQSIPAYSGRGHQTVVEYLAAHPGINSGLPAAQR
jgi:hypothetical protein